MEAGLSCWDRAGPVFRIQLEFLKSRDAFAESGLLHGEEKVFLFGCIEPQLLSFGGRWRTTCIPVVVAIVSPFPPSDKIAILSLQDESEEIINMEDMNMGWAPYIPPGDRASSVPEIFILSRAHGEAAFELDPSSQCCLPYFYNPFMADEIQQNTVVGILYPTEAGPVVCEFDWDIDELEEFTDELIAAGELSRDHRHAFKEFVRQKVQEAQRDNHEATQKQIQAQEELQAEGKAAAFENMRLYKFYPVATPDTPDVSRAKFSFIKRYFGKAHQVL